MCVFEDENVLLASESVLMETTRAEILNPHKYVSRKVRILVDCGSQRTYIPERLATELNLNREEETEIRVVTFGSTTHKVIKKNRLLNWT